jgi:uncharacterized protein (DUF1501 family)
MSVSRRNFLQASLGGAAAAAIGARVPALPARAAAAGRPQDNRGTVLVVLEMNGGNDGLNTVVPYADDNYARSRPTLRLKAGEVLRIDSQLGLHPRMRAFKRLYDEGHLAIVQGVGYPNQDRNHPGSRRIWETARLKPEGCQTGWLGRAVDLVYRPDDALVPAVFLGQSGVPFALNAMRTVVPAFRSLQQYRLQAATGPGGRETLRRLAEITASSRTDDPLLGFLSGATQAAYADSEKLEAAIRAGAAAPRPYPSFPLAQMLSSIATLIRAEIGIRIFYTEVSGGSFGGFDNHAGQAGNHAALLEAMAESVAAFTDDLGRDKLLDRVLMMTVSEFGRTVAENGRRGTDHGAAAPMFLVGGKVKGGLVGPHPSLTDLDNNALRFHTDFRRVYATVLDRWLGWDSRAVLGESFPPLEVLR